MGFKYVGLNQNITGFILSILFSIIWMSEFKLNLLKKSFYILINAFLLFFTALGGNTVVSHSVTTQAYYNYSNAQPISEIERSFFDPWL